MFKPAKVLFDVKMCILKKSFCYISRVMGTLCFAHPTISVSCRWYIPDSIQ